MVGVVSELTMDGVSKVAGIDEGVDKATGYGGEVAETPTTNSKPSVTDEKPSDFQWDLPALGEFWQGCFPAGYNVFILDGLHPKALCSKICNDILRTNINVNSSSQNPNDRLLCFEVLANMEAKFIELGIVEPPVQKPGGTPNQQVYKRVLHTDFNKFSHVLNEANMTLEQWAREVVESSLHRLQEQRKKL